MKIFYDQICALEILPYSYIEIPLKENGIRVQRINYYAPTAVHKESDGTRGIDIRRRWW